VGVENSILRRIIGPRNKKMIGEGIELHNAEIRGLYSFMTPAQAAGKGLLLQQKYYRDLGIVKVKLSMWEPRRLTTLSASTTCYGDSFTLWRRSVLPVRYELDCKYCYK
jgi:hypothetical protein